MANLDEVRELALAFPEVEERLSAGSATWRVRDRLFVFERPLRRADLEALGEHAPTGVVLAARVPDLGAKDALLSADPRIYFTTPHFDGYPAILVRLKRIEHGELAELIGEAWLCRAPARLARTYLTR